MVSFNIKAYLFILVFQASLAADCKSQQVADPNFLVSIEHPSYLAEKGPMLLVDEAHNNPFSMKGQYAGFAQVAAKDGYRLSTTNIALSANQLEEARIFVSINAIYNPTDWNLPTHSIYTDEEIELLFNWVMEGGSLLLVTDHMPCAGSISALATKFGFNLINGFALLDYPAPELFSASLGNLYASAVTQHASRPVEQIRFWGSTGFIAPKEAEVITALTDAYKVYLPSKIEDVTYPVASTVPYISGKGLANSALLKVGKGRVALFADGAVFSAQLQGVKSEKRGMNHPDAEHHVNLLLNVLQWLAEKP
ncbi:DUF4350 domain-containing protein [Sphingobacterium hungaricum]|uniref:DUF4350 domain-containing protein n=1 Tax=Sphingobacterium hungaricum TaxID=2082723 RepID=A0A928YQ84_9SPHI|nr:DUF4350 domain-containing protein [Sphingobacterium hungaricum]MBE8712153.1 hypothetical protein [Sphingobacterium hungaricum]